jgi:hypothetical protein
MGVGVAEREYWKEKINELEIHRKNNNIRDMYNGIIDFIECGQSQNNTVNDERDDLIADPHSILNM